MPKMSYDNANSIMEVFRRLSPEEVKSVEKNVLKACLHKGFVYEDKDGSKRIIPLMLRPRLIRKDLVQYIWKVCEILNRAFIRVPTIFFRDRDAEILFPFQAGERAWLYNTYPGREYRPETSTVLARWDANTSFSGRREALDFFFFENNGVGIGGLWYCPVGEEILLEHVIPPLQKVDPRLSVAKNDDARGLLYQLILRHAEVIKKKRVQVGLVIDRASGENYIEFPLLAKYFKEKFGLSAWVADPRELKLKEEEIFVKDHPVDILYRDTQLSEFLEMERRGENLEALKLAFKRDQVISSLAGEFDHKSLFELFTSDRFARHFTPEERRIFKKHILWTRLLRETETQDPKGRKVDLVSYTRKNQSDLVLKPNRLFGGEGVTLGAEAGRKEWDQMIAEGLATGGSVVVQSLAPLHVKRFPLPKEGGPVSEDDFYAVAGFISTPDGLGILGRVSKFKVVNVARKGGISAVLVR